MKALQYYKKYTQEQLVELMAKEDNDPANSNPDYAAGKTIWKTTKEARARKDAIARAITWHMIDKQKAAGTYVDHGGDGYSVRKQNRRR